MMNKNGLQVLSATKNWRTKKLSPGYAALERGSSTGHGILETKSKGSFEASLYPMNC
jgi:hypothetical protein